MDILTAELISALPNPAEDLDPNVALLRWRLAPETTATHDWQTKFIMFEALMLFS